MLTGVLLGGLTCVALALAVLLVRRRRRGRPLAETALPIVEVDQRGLIRRSNAAFAELVGGPEIPARLTDLVHPDDLAAFVAGVLGDLRLANPVRASFRLLRTDAGVRHVELLADASRSRVRRLLVLDVSEDADDELRRRQDASMARLDELTGLPNRAALADHLTRALRDVRRGSRPVVLFVELDDLGGLGERERELVVLEASRRLAATARGLDHVSRFGDHQFVVIASGVTDNDGALSAARRIGQALEGAVVFDDASAAAVRASIGIAHPWAEDTALNVLRRAQDALVRARGAVADEPG